VVIKSRQRRDVTVVYRVSVSIFFVVVTSVQASIIRPILLESALADLVHKCVTSGL